jgi:hypothetical protein
MGRLGTDRRSMRMAGRSQETPRRSRKGFARNHIVGARGAAKVMQLRMHAYLALARDPVPLDGRL